MSSSCSIAIILAQLFLPLIFTPVYNDIKRFGVWSYIYFCNAFAFPEHTFGLNQSLFQCSCILPYSLLNTAIILYYWHLCPTRVILSTCQLSLPTLNNSHKLVSFLYKESGSAQVKVEYVHWSSTKSSVVHNKLLLFTLLVMKYQWQKTF